MDSTENTGLPYIWPAQAQKHVTHNEALRILDTIVQAGVTSRSMQAPPDTPAGGERYIVPEGAGGIWSGQTHALASFRDGAWAFHAPGPGWLVWIADERMLAVWDGSAWTGVEETMSSLAGVTPLADGTYDRIGINGAAADPVNRLSVRTEAVLFDSTHASQAGGSGDCRVKINKNGTTATASQIFQNAYSGRVEIGLAGDDSFRIRVSPDGTQWNDVMVLEGDTGHVGIGQAQTGTITLNGNGVVAGMPAGGARGKGSLNAEAVYDDRTLLSCYVFDQKLDGSVSLEKWDRKVPVRKGEKKEGSAGTGDTGPEEEPVHVPLRRFAARIGTRHDPMTLDGYARHWKEKRHLTSMPNETAYRPETGLAAGEWIQRLVETVELHALLIEELNQRTKPDTAGEPATGKGRAGVTD